MHLRPPVIEVDDVDPFRSDLLGRRQTADSLTELARSAHEGLVVSLHSPWGTGKSTFIRMWQAQLKKSGFRTITFNAWETDFSDDPLVALIGELEAGLSAAQAGDNEGSALRTSLLKARAIGGKLIKAAVPTAIKVATAGALDLDTFTKEAVADLTAKLAEDKIAAYESAKRSIKAFRESIAEVAMAATSDPATGEKLPLVFIVDELDRCRPPYAIRVLECIKHFFAVPGVIFVLAVDAEQLAHTVCSQYGATMDAHGYLRRFFDIELTLPDPENSDFSRAQFTRFNLEKTFQARRVSYQTHHEQQNLLEVFEALFNVFSCSLRDRERCFTLLSFALRSTKPSFSLYPLVLATLIVLKVKETSLYSKIKRRNVTAEEVVAAISAKPGAIALWNSNYGDWTQACLYSAFAPQHELEVVLAQLNQRIDGTSNESEKTRLESIVKMIESREGRATAGSLAYLLKKIDLVSSN